jgi:hypothetical protein
MMNKNLNLSEALSFYGSLIKNNKPQQPGFDPNAYNYRNEMMGRESSDRGYRSVIFYIPFSKKIEPEVLDQFFRKTEPHLASSGYSKGRYHLFFLNDEQGKLIHPAGKCEGNLNATRATEDYFAKYADTNGKYAKKLTQLTPEDDGYASSRFPSKHDLCVLVTDEDGIDIDDDVKSGMVNRTNRLIHLKLLPENMFEVQRIYESDLNTI